MKYLTTKFSKRVGVIVANNTEYVEAMLSCIEAGNIAVPLRNIDDHYRINAVNIAEIVVPTENRSWMRREFIPFNTSEPALISFTSGTEGSPKGVVLSHNNLADVITRLNSVMQVDSSIREYIGVPVYHSFGFGRCRAVLTAGGKFFIPSNGFNPLEINEMLKKGEINAISAVPSLWRVLLLNKDVIGSNGKKVRWIEIGSQYMSRQEKEEMKALFPEAKIIQHYGLTEASRTTLLQIHEVEGDRLDSVGQALGGIEVKQSLEGHIAIRGNHVGLCYLIDGQEVALRDEDGWFLTKDLGSLKDGYLYYNGRADDVINCGGIKVHPEALETIIYRKIGCSSGLAVCRKTDSTRGEGFLVAVTEELTVSKKQLQKVILQSTQELGINAGNAITIIDVDGLPKTATGKIQRKLLAEWYANEFKEQLLTATDTLSVTPSIDCSPIQAIFYQVFAFGQIQPHDTFISLGGDSLSFVQASMRLERYLGYLPRKWEQMPFEDLEKLVPQRKRSTIIEMNILLRSLAISGVVLTHSHLYFFEGGSLLLLLIAGANFARFQGCALIKGQFQSIVSLLRNILIPYLTLAIAYQIWKQKFDPAILLLVGNFQSIELQISNSIFFVWFIANLVQCIVLFSLPFSIQTLRNFASPSPWKFGLIYLGVGICTHLLGPKVWDTSYLSNQVPHMLFWLFALGWCIHFAKSKTEKIVTTVITSIITPMFTTSDSLQMWWILVGAIALIWLPYVPVPRIISSPLKMISAAAYYIYLTDMIFVHFFTRVAGINYPLVTAIVALSGGVLTWLLAQSLQQFVLYKRFGKLGYTDLLSSDRF